MTPAVSDPPASLAILGSWPPPYGGVSIHVQRLCPLLERRGVRYVVYNATSDAGDGRRVLGVYRRRRTWLLKYFFTAREPAVYILSGRLSAWIVGGLMAALRGKRVLLRLRNAALPDWIERSPVRRALAGFALRRMEAVVCVSKALIEASRRVGVGDRRLHWSPGFLPPAANSDERSAVAALVWTFLESRRPLIAANGKVDWYHGEDLYGLDLLVDLAARLKGDYPTLGIVVCFWDHHGKDQARVADLVRRAGEAGVGDRILFNTRSGPFVPVLAACDVFVRPTNTDGDANSIREAIYLGVPAVASDAVERPAGTRLFRNRDLGDLEAQMRAALREAAERRRHANPRLAEADQRRIDAYLDLLERVSRGN